MVGLEGLPGRESAVGYYVGTEAAEQHVIGRLVLGVQFEAVALEILHGVAALGEWLAYRVAEDGEAAVGLPVFEELPSEVVARLGEVDRLRVGNCLGGVDGLGDNRELIAVERLEAHLQPVAVEGGERGHSGLAVGVGAEQADAPHVGCRYAEDARQIERRGGYVGGEQGHAASLRAHDELRRGPGGERYVRAGVGLAPGDERIAGRVGEVYRVVVV